ncbi:MAG: DM13 domain-containing protein [Nitrososphaeraceae archaeon]
MHISTDKKTCDSVNVGRLKGNIGHQNYEIPQDVDLYKYNMVLIWAEHFQYFLEVQNFNFDKNLVV